MATGDLGVRGVEARDGSGGSGASIVGHVALVLALTAYEVWLDDPDAAEITDLLEVSLAALAHQVL